MRAQNHNYAVKGLVLLTLFYLFIEAILITSTGLLRLVPTFVMTLFAILSFFLVWRHKRTAISLWVMIYWIVAGLSAVLIGSYDTGLIVTYLRSTYWCAVFFVSVALLGRDVLVDTTFDRVVFMTLILMTFAFFINNRNYSRAEDLIGNNGVYYPLLLLPWVSAITNRRWKWIGLAIIVLCVLVSLKRSATLIILGSLIVVFFFDFLYGKRKRKTLSTLFLAAFVIALGGAILFFNSDRVSAISERFDSIEEDGGNGRDVIYADVLARFSKEPIEQQFFGRGYNMVRGDSTMAVPVSAHNDFLEVLYDYGYIGLLVFIMLHLSIIKLAFHYTKERFYLAPSFWVSYVCFLIMSLVSHLMIYPTYVVYLVSFWAFSENQYKLAQ